MHERVVEMRDKASNGMRTIFEEAADLLEAMGRELAEMVEVVVLGVVGADGYDLVILLSLFKKKKQRV